MTEEAHEIEEEQIDAQEIDTDDSQQAVVADADPVKDWTDEDEEEARLFGWKSPDEWQGDKPPGYIGKPTEFLDRVQRSRVFKAMQEKLTTTEQRQAEHTRRMEAMNDRALKMQQAEYERQMQSITAAQRKAVEEADTDAYDRLEKQRQGISAPAQERDTPAPQADSYVQEYAASENGKWLQNPLLLNTGRQLIDNNPVVRGLDSKAQIAYAEAEVRKMYPAYFPKAEPAPKPAARNVVDGGGLASGSSATAGQFGKLPGDAKAQFKRFVETGVFKDNKDDREEYANEYFAG